MQGGWMVAHLHARTLFRGVPQDWPSSQGKRGSGKKRTKRGNLCGPRVSLLLYLCASGFSQSPDIFVIVLMWVPRTGESALRRECPPPETM